MIIVDVPRGHKKGRLNPGIIKNALQFVAEHINDTARYMRQAFPETELWCVKKNLGNNKFDLIHADGVRMMYEVPAVDLLAVRYLQPPMAVVVRYYGGDRNKPYIRGFGGFLKPATLPVWSMSRGNPQLSLVQTAGFSLPDLTATPQLIAGPFGDTQAKTPLSALCYFNSGNASLLALVTPIKGDSSHFFVKALNLDGSEVWSTKIGSGTGSAFGFFNPIYSPGPVAGPFTNDLHVQYEPDSGNLIVFSPQTFATTAGLGADASSHQEVFILDSGSGKLVSQTAFDFSWHLGCLAAGGYLFKGWHQHLWSTPTKPQYSGAGNLSYPLVAAGQEIQKWSRFGTTGSTITDSYRLLQAYKLNNGVPALAWKIDPVELFWGASVPQNALICGSTVANIGLGTTGTNPPAYSDALGAVLLFLGGHIGLDNANARDCGHFHKDLPFECVGLLQTKTDPDSNYIAFVSPVNHYTEQDGRICKASLLAINPGNASVQWRYDFADLDASDPSTYVIDQASFDSIDINCYFLQTGEGFAGTPGHNGTFTVNYTIMVDNLPHNPVPTSHSFTVTPTVTVIGLPTDGQYDNTEWTGLADQLPSNLSAPPGNIADGIIWGTPPGGATLVPWGGPSRPWPTEGATPDPVTLVKFLPGIANDFVAAYDGNAGDIPGFWESDITCGKKIGTSSKKWPQYKYWPCGADFVLDPTPVIVPTDATAGFSLGSISRGTIGTTGSGLAFDSDGNCYGAILRPFGIVTCRLPNANPQGPNQNSDGQIGSIVAGAKYTGVASGWVYAWGGTSFYFDGSGNQITQPDIVKVNPGGTYLGQSIQYEVFGIPFRCIAYKSFLCSWDKKGKLRWQVEQTAYGSDEYFASSSLDGKVPYAGCTVKIMPTSACVYILRTQRLVGSEAQAKTAKYLSYNGHHGLELCKVLIEARDPATGNLLRSDEVHNPIPAGKGFYIGALNAVASEGPVPFVVGRVDAYGDKNGSTSGRNLVSKLFTANYKDGIVQTVKSSVASNDLWSLLGSNAAPVINPIAAAVADGIYYPSCDQANAEKHGANSWYVRKL